MARVFKKTSSIKLPQQNRAAQHEEYGPEHKGIVGCAKCDNVHFKKRWIPSLDELREREKNSTLKVSSRATCPACTMKKEHLYEGEIILEAFPTRLKEEMLNLIKNFGERAVSQDPQDRIIDIIETPSGLRITTTENQLANRLAKKIRDVFNTVTVNFSHSQEPYEVNRIRVTFTG